MRQFDASTVISSRANDRVKQVRALRNRHERETTKAFFAEGPPILRAALETGADILLLVLCPDRLSPEDELLSEQISRRQPPVLEVTAAVFDSLSFREEGQSIGAVVQQRWETLDADITGRRCWVALHNIQHPGNLGTIIRTTDAIGGDGVLLSGRSTDPYNPVAVRGTLGSIFTQRMISADPAELASWTRTSGCNVIGASPDGDIDFREADYASRPVVLFMGNERGGLSPDQRDLCDTVVRIPMGGYVESLNLAVAAGLILYEVQRQNEA